MFIETKLEPVGKSGNGGKTLTISTSYGEHMPVEGRLFSIAWNGDNALVLMLNTQRLLPRPRPRPRLATIKMRDAALRRAEDENNELRAVLDTATDGVLVDRPARAACSRPTAARRRCWAWGGELRGAPPSAICSLESRRAALDYLDRPRANTLINEGRELIGYKTSESSNRHNASSARSARGLRR